MRFLINRYIDIRILLQNYSYGFQLSQGRHSLFFPKKIIFFSHI